jgi:hypothetical protein
MLQTAVAAKRVELLRELVPSADSIAFLVNSANPGFANPEAKQVREAARVLGLKLLVLNASTPSEIDAAFARIVQQQTGRSWSAASLLHQSDRSTRHAGGPPRRPDDIRLSRTGNRWRAHVLPCWPSNTQRNTWHVYRAYS